MLTPTRKRTPQQIALDNLLNQNEIAKVDIARALGVTRGCVCLVLAGRRRNNEVFNLIAGVLGLTVEELREKYIPPYISPKKAA